MKRLLICLLVCVVAVGLSVGNASAKGKVQEVKIVTADSVYPEGGDSLGLNMYFNALVGATERDPAMRGLKFKVYPNGMLYGSQDECVMGVASGAAQITYAGPQHLEQIAPEFRLFNTPGYVLDWNHFQRVLNTPAWKELHRDIAKEKGLTIVKWMYDLGPWLLFVDKGPAKKLEDIKGKKIRFAGGEGMAKAMAAMEINAIALPYSETVSALQTHMVEGILTDMVSAKVYYNVSRYCKFVNRIPWMLQPLCLVVNTEWYESLSPEARASFNAPFERINVNQYYKDQEEVVVQEWRDRTSTTVVEVDPAEADRWYKVMKTAYGEILTGIDPKYVDAIESTR